MAISDEIQRISQAKSDIRQAIIDKGVDVPASAKIDTYDTYVEQISGGGGETIPLNVIENNETYTRSAGYSPVNVSIPTWNQVAYHINPTTLKWERPEEWDDIESIEIDEDESVAYYLLDCHQHEWAFFRFRIYGSGLKASYGHVVDGVYVPSVEDTTISSGGYYKKEDLDDLEDDYIVVKISGTSITYITNSARSTAPLITALNMPILMRYANLPKATALSTGGCYTIESDVIMNWFRDVSDKSFSLASWHSTSYNLKRLRLPNHNFVNQRITSYSSLLGTCVNLVDVNIGGENIIDCTGWVTSYCTSVSSMFSACYNLRAKIIVRNWDLSNLTTMASAFSNCYCVPDIIGTETWNSAPKVTTIATLFSGCYAITSKIDLSNCYFGNGTENLTTVSSLFANCWSLKEVDVSNINLSKCTTVSGMFSYCRSLKHIDLSNCDPITSVCTTAASLCNYCFSLEEFEVDGWDFTNASVLSMFYYCTAIKRIDFPNCTPSTFTQSDGSSSVIFGYCYSLEYLDCRNLISDMSIFSSTYMHSSGFNTQTQLTECYMPNGFQKAFTISGNTKWSHDTLLRFIDALDTVNNLKFTIGTINKAKLSTAEQALITSKGWTIA